MVDGMKNTFDDPDLNYIFVSILLSEMHSFDLHAGNELGSFLSPSMEIHPTNQTILWSIKDPNQCLWSLLSYLGGSLYRAFDWPSLAFHVIDLFIAFLDSLI